MRTAVFGAGGIGGYLGGRLSQAGGEVVVIARGDHLDAIRKRGLTVDSIKGDFVANPEFVTNDPSQVGKVDLIILGVKAWQVPDAAEVMHPMIGPKTAVLLVQNGVDAPAQLAAVLGAEHVVIGLCMLRSFIVGPGYLRHTADVYPNLQLGEMALSTTDRVEELSQIFKKIGLSVTIPSDIYAALWEKYLVFSVASALGAITRTTTGVWRSIPETRQMAETAVRELVRVGQSQGIKLSDQTFDNTMRLIDNWAEDHTTSMAKDLMEGRPSELEAAIGHVVGLGRESGVDAPMINFIHHSLLPQELQARS